MDSVFTVQELFRKAKKKFIEKHKLSTKDIRLLTKFLSFLQEEEKANMTLLNNRYQTIYIKGVAHGFIFLIILYLFFKK